MMTDLKTIKEPHFTPFIPLFSLGEDVSFSKEMSIPFPSKRVLFFNSLKKVYEQSFHDSVLQYVIDWERSIVSRIVASLEKAENLRLETTFYEEKLKYLSSPTNDWFSTMFLGWSWNDLQSSEEESLLQIKIKYQAAQDTYTQYMKDLRLLIEEVTDRGWRDLFPVLTKLSLLDSSLAADENCLFSELIGITTRLNDAADRYGYRYESRINELGHESSDTPSTRCLDDLGDGGIEECLSDHITIVSGSCQSTYELKRKHSSVDKDFNIQSEEFNPHYPITPRRCSPLNTDRETPTAFRSRYLLEAEEVFKYFLDDD